MKLPEGVTLDLESPVTKSFLSLANELKLTPEQAQKFVDLQVQSATEASERGSSSHAEMVGGWRTALEADPEIGGPKLTETLRQSNRIVDQFGTPKLKEALQLTGFGNHPEFGRLLAKIAPFITEPPPIGGGNKGGGGPKPTVNDLYPEQK